MKILALQLKRLGDLVLTTPALEMLGREGEVTLAVHRASQGLLNVIPGLHGAIVFGPGAGWTPWQQLLWGRFDRVVDFTGSDRSALITALSRARIRQTFRRAQSPWLRRMPYTALIESPVRDQHTADHYAALAGKGAPPPPRLEIPEGARVAARHLCGEEPYALIHAGTARPEKYWQPERWAVVAEHLQRRHGLRCLLTGGATPGEMAHLEAIQHACPAPLRNYAGQLKLASFAAVVAGAKLVLSVDTVAVHLAAALERPQIALFGPTNPFHWRPRHARAVVFSAAQPEAPLTTFEPRRRGAPMDRLSTAPIIHATDELLSR